MPLPSIDDFRTLLPEFLDAATYPDAQVSAWIGISANFVNETRWGSSYALGVSLVTAHNLVLGKRDQDVAALGGTPGEVMGLVNSKTVGPLSTGHDTASVVSKDPSNWNATSYGSRYRTLARVFSAGGFQL